MTANLTVFNRQRTLPVDIFKLERNYEKLRKQVFLNLLQKRPAHLNKAGLGAIAERGSFSVAIVSNRQIAALNKEWMGKSGPTDVLSFPLELEPPPVADIPWQVGEIVISIERAREQARQFGHGLERELAFLFVHGMLHVLGFDHHKAAEEKDMFGRQKAILYEAGFRR